LIAEFGLRMSSGTFAAKEMTLGALKHLLLQGTAHQPTYCIAGPRRIKPQTYPDLLAEATAAFDARSVR